MQLIAKAFFWVHVTLYRLTNGRIGGKFIAGSPILLHTTTGRRTGKQGTDQLRNREEVGCDGPLQLLDAGAGCEPEVPGNGVELEAVAVRAVPAGWAWAAVADRAEVVAPLCRCCLPLAMPTGTVASGDQRLRWPHWDT